MKEASAESARFEPTVFGAVRRYRAMVVGFAVAAMVAAVGYTLVAGKTYTAQASVTAPVPQSPPGQDPAQYLDSQVLLLESPQVAQRAASIANAALHGNQLSAQDFSSTDGSVSVSPPAGANPGTYGASITDVTFTSSSPTIAQVGVNALLQAFEQERAAGIKAQANATITGIDNVIKGTSDPAVQSALAAQRAQTLVNEQADLAQQPTIAWATDPVSPVGGGWKRTALIGLVIGLILGATLAYVRAHLRRGFADRHDPAALYGAPLIGEIPSLEAGRTLRPHAAPAGSPLPMSTDPRSAAAEAFRFAAATVQRVCAGRDLRPSLVFVSPRAGVSNSVVVANLALAIAEGGWRVLAVDGNGVDGNLTALLLPGSQTGDGLERVLAGRAPLAGGIQPSPLNGAVAVLGSGPAARRQVTGAARSKAAAGLLAKAKESFDFVLIDGPPLLQSADATELVDASDAAIVVVSLNDLIPDHLEMADRLNLVGADVAGYIYSRTPTPSPLARYLRSGSSARPAGPPDEGLTALLDGQPLDGKDAPLSEMQHG